MKSHCARILEILRRGETISQLEASRWNDPCLRLGARIKDLRAGKHDGIKWIIETITVKNADGRGTHARYRMNVKFYIVPQVEFHRMIDEITSLAPELAETVDDSTTVMTIETPRNWKCPRPGCRTDYQHTHGIYSTLVPAFAPKKKKAEQPNLFKA